MFLTFFADNVHKLRFTSRVDFGHVEPLFHGRQAKFGDGPIYELPDPLLRDAHLASHLLQGHRLATGVQSVAIADDPSLAIVELFQQLGDHAYPLDLGRLFGSLIGPLVGRRQEHLVTRVAEPSVVAVLSRNGLRKVPNDRAGGIRAEPEPPGIVELLDGPHQRDVSVAHQLEQRLRDYGHTAWSSPPPAAGSPG